MNDQENVVPRTSCTDTIPGIEGFRVRSMDGHIVGRVDQLLPDELEPHFVVNTGPWIFGRQVVLPMGSIAEIDTQSKTVLVNRTKRQIKDAQPFVTKQDINAEQLTMNPWWPGMPWRR